MKKVFLIAVIGMMLINSVNAFSFKFELLGYTIAYSPKLEQQIINNVAPQQVQQQTAYTTQINQDNAKIQTTQSNVYQTYSVPLNTPTITHKFDEEVKYLNSIKEVQLILKELDYQNIGIIDKDTGNYYTAIINSEGIIVSVYDGAVNPEIEIKGSFSKTKQLISRGEYNLIRDEVEVPFKLKIKLIWMRWFP